MKGKHPADLCMNNKLGKPSCHSCGGSCSGSCASHNSAEEDIIAQITKNVLAQLGK